MQVDLKKLLLEQNVVALHPTTLPVYNRFAHKNAVRIAALGQVKHAVIELCLVVGRVRVDCLHILAVDDLHREFIAAPASNSRRTES